MHNSGKSLFSTRCEIVQLKRNRESKCTDGNLLKKFCVVPHLGQMKTAILKCVVTYLSYAWLSSSVYPQGLAFWIHEPVIRKDVFAHHSRISPEQSS